MPTRALFRTSSKWAIEMQQKGWRREGKGKGEKKRDDIFFSIFSRKKGKGPREEECGTDGARSPFWGFLFSPLDPRLSSEPHVLPISIWLGRKWERMRKGEEGEERGIFLFIDAFPYWISRHPFRPKKGGSFSHPPPALEKPFPPPPSVRSPVARWVRGEISQMAPKTGGKRRKEWPTSEEEFFLVSLYLRKCAGEKRGGLGIA